MLVAKAEKLIRLEKAKLVVRKAREDEKNWVGSWTPKAVLEAPFELGFFTSEAEQDCHLHPKAYEVYIFFGEGIVTNGLEEVRVSQGDVVIFLPGERHLVRLLQGFGYAFLVGEPIKVKLPEEECWREYEDSTLNGHSLRKR